MVAEGVEVCARGEGEERGDGREGQHEAVEPGGVGVDVGDVDLEDGQGEGEDHRGDEVRVDVCGFVVEVGEGLEAAVYAVGDGAVARCDERGGLVAVPVRELVVGEEFLRGFIFVVGVLGSLATVSGGLAEDVQREPEGDG